MKQKAVTGSSTETEYIVLSHGVKEGLWISMLLKQLELEVRPFTIMEDNQSCIAIASHPVQHHKQRILTLHIIWSGITLNRELLSSSM
jgi:hypothetical protein